MRHTEWPERLWAIWNNAAHCSFRVHRATTPAKHQIQPLDSGQILTLQIRCRNLSMFCVETDQIMLLTNGSRGGQSKEMTQHINVLCYQYDVIVSRYLVAKRKWCTGIYKKLQKWYDLEIVTCATLERRVIFALTQPREMFIMWNLSLGVQSEPEVYWDVVFIWRIVRSGMC